MTLDDITQSDFEQLVATLALDKLVPAVSGGLPPAEKQRKSETAHAVTDSFSIPWAEFDYIAKRELWDGYVKVLVTRAILRVKAHARQRTTRLKFFRFKHDPSTAKQRILVFDADGVFATLAIRCCAHQTHKEKTTPVAEFTFRIEFGEFDN